MNKKETVPKFDAFINYCNANMKGKKLRELIFSNEGDVATGFYNHWPMFKTHGHWIIQIDFVYFKYKRKHYSIGFQYQNETCKINCMQAGKDYWSSNPEEIKNFIDIFENNAPMGYRVNKPKTRAYVSMSKKHRGIANLSDDEFAKKVFLEMMKAKDIIDHLIDLFKKKGCQFLW